MADPDCNDSLPLSGTWYNSPASGWYYVVVSESESTGPRQPISNWIPRSGLVTYGVILAFLAMVINVTLCVLAARRRYVYDLSDAITGSESTTMTSSSSWRRLAVINFAAVQLAVGVIIVPVKVMTDTFGVWTIGATACRAYLLGQVCSSLNLIVQYSQPFGCPKART